MATAQRAPKKPPKKEPGPEALARDVKQTVEMFTQAWAANDADGVRRACADEVVMTESARRLRTLQTLLDYQQFNAKNFPGVEIQLGPIETRVAGTMAWAHANCREVLATAHGLKLNYAGYSSYVLERRREGWKIVLVDFNLQPAETASSDNPKSAPPSLQGTWMLESSKDLSTSQARQLAATLILTKSHFCVFVAAPDRQPPKNKRVSDYSRKDLLELLRDVDSSTGIYRQEGNNVIFTPGVTLLPNQAGQEVTWENVKVTAERLSYEVTTPDSRFQRVWRRVE
jgi:ketosteroid isomerase-like protein